MVNNRYQNYNLYFKLVEVIKMIIIQLVKISVISHLNILMWVIKYKIKVRDTEVKIISYLLITRTTSKKMKHLQIKKKPRLPKIRKRQ